MNDIDVFLNMMEEDYYEEANYKDEDYYEVFRKICLNYGDKSIEPYCLFIDIINEEIPCEKYYMRMLMDVYSDYGIGEDFLEQLQMLIDEGYCVESQKEAREIIKDHIQDGYIIAYRGEFATKEYHNLDYKESVSYSLTYDKAKHFATRFKMLPLVKSIVYTVKVPVEDVLAYIDREDEVVCLPICMDGKMQVIKEESFL